MTTDDPKALLEEWKKTYTQHGALAAHALIPALFVMCNESQARIEALEGALKPLTEKDAWEFLERRVKPIEKPPKIGDPVPRLIVTRIYRCKVRFAAIEEEPWEHFANILEPSDDRE